MSQPDIFTPDPVQYGTGLPSVDFLSADVNVIEFYGSYTARVDEPYIEQVINEVASHVEGCPITVLTIKMRFKRVVTRGKNRMVQLIRRVAEAMASRNDSDDEMEIVVQFDAGPNDSSQLKNVGFVIEKELIEAAKENKLGDRLRFDWVDHNS